MQKFLLICTLAILSSNLFAATRVEDCIQQHKNLAHCGLTDEDAPEIIKYINKHADGVVALNGNKLTDVGLIEIINHVNKIKGVNISDNPITDKSAIPLVNIKTMEWVEMNNTKITDETLKAIAANKNIWWMNLANDNITDEGVQALMNRKELDTVDLRGNHITDKGAAVLADISFLGDLNLDHNDIGDNGASALAKLSTKVSLNYNHITDSGALALIQSTNSNHTELNLEGNLLTDRTAERLARYDSPRYSYLTIGANKITLAGVRKIILSNNFMNISLNNSHYGDEVAEIFGQTNLSDVSLSGNDITDAGVAALMQNQRWESLVLEDNLITDSGFMMMLALPTFHKYPHANSLLLARNKITDSGIQALLNQDVHIEYFTIRGNLVSEEMIQALSNHKQVANLEG